MATYTIVPEGGAEAGGCAEAWLVLTFEYEFAENDTAFSREKAVNGILEEVVIEEVQIGQDRYGRDYITYKDTWHGIWNENELVAEQDAIDIAILYYVAQIAEWGRVEFCVESDDIMFSDILEDLEDAIARLESITDISTPVGGSYERTIRLGR